VGTSFLTVISRKPRGTIFWCALVARKWELPVEIHAIK
jgi:hypothetical protein